jgi:signal transduction histidine kinase
VVLVRAADEGTAAFVVALPEAPPADLDPALFAPAFGADDAVQVGPVAGHGTVLAVGLRPLDDHRWSIGLVRPRPAWTSAEREAFGALRPHLELVLEHALLRGALQGAAEREKGAAAEHERFLSVISHELRNPLAPIPMWTSTLRRLRGEDPEVHRATTAIANAIGLARRLLDDLLDLSRLERGTIEVVMQRVDLRDVARLAVDAARRAAGDARLSLELDLPPEPVAVQADPVRLGQVVASLLDNAVSPRPRAAASRSASRARRGRHARSRTAAPIPTR